MMVIRASSLATPLPEFPTTPRRATGGSRRNSWFLVQLELPFSFELVAFVRRDEEERPGVPQRQAARCLDVEAQRLKDALDARLDAFDGDDRSAAAALAGPGTAHAAWLSNKE